LRPSFAKLDTGTCFPTETLDPFAAYLRSQRKDRAKRQRVVSQQKSQGMAGAGAKTDTTTHRVSADRNGPAIVWFRHDLRVADNLALNRAIDLGGAVLALFILDETSKDVRPLGGAQRWWLHHSLQALEAKLANLGIPLVLRRGTSADIVRQFVEDAGAAAIFWNRRYDPAGVAIDMSLKADLGRHGLTVESFEGHLLHEPTRVKTGKGDPYRVYTPFWKAIDGQGDPRDPVAAPGKAQQTAPTVPSDILADWKLLPTKPNWATTIAETWTPGEDGAHERLNSFIEAAFDGYGAGRDIPGIDGTSRLSPHLAFGEITPYQIWRETKRRPQQVSTEDRVTFRKELVWREFSYHLLFHFPDLPKANFNERFDRFRWSDDQSAFTAWTKGETGYPIVDAGMRQLWQTGWMQNRVRMIVASFLTKHLLLDWRRGEDWFWDTLVDADPASNSASWQWVSGSGADAAPYFRVFQSGSAGREIRSRRQLCAPLRA
jgi:deoxyribodipyrimidine photo-lyase